MSTHWTNEPGARHALLGPNAMAVDCPTCGAPRGFLCNAPREGEFTKVYCPKRVEAADAMDGTRP